MYPYLEFPDHREKVESQACAATLTESIDTCYLQVTWISTLSELAGSLEGLVRIQIMPFFPCWLV